MIRNLRMGLWAVLLLAGATAWGGGFCRSGEVTTASSSSVLPAISDLDEYAFDKKEGNYRYVTVTIRPDAGRAMSIFDYSLLIGTVDYPCIALRVGNGAYSASDRTVTDFGGQDVSLLFRLPASALYSRQDVNLHYRLAASGLLNTLLSL